MPTTRARAKARKAAEALDNELIGLQYLPLELVAAIADYVHEFPHLAAMMLVSHRLRDGVSLSRQWRIVNEVVAEVAEVEDRRKILFDRQQIILHASRLWNARLLRYLQLTREEAYSLCLPVACIHGHLEFVRSLMTKFDIKNKLECCNLLPMGTDWGVCEDILARDYPDFEGGFVVGYSPFEIACACPTGLPLVKYFHEECGVSETSFDAIEYAANAGRLDTLKYLHTAFGLTAENTCAERGGALDYACLYGHLPVVQYLLTVVGLTADDARNTDALTSACQEGQLHVVEYLHTAFGLGVDDARDVYNLGEALRYACMSGHLPVVRYLHTAFGLTADDARADVNYALRLACEGGHLPVVQYLHTAFGLTGLVPIATTHFG